MRPEASSSPKPIRSATDISTPVPQKEDGGSVAGAPAGNHDKAGETPFAGLSELQALSRWFDQETSEAAACRVLRALVAESQKAVSRSAAARRFTDDDLVDAAELDSFAWKTVEKWWKSREPRVVEAMRAAGLEMAPYLDRNPGGGRGNKATTAWCLRPFVTMDEAENTDGGGLDSDRVRYERDDRHPIRLSGPLQRWLFRGGEVVVGSRRHRLIRVRVLAPILLGIFLGGGTLLAMLYGNGPLTRADAATLLVVGMLPWAWWDTWKPLKYALWDRISALPPEWLAGDEPAQLEVARTPSGKVLRLVRYVAPCPICGADLQLADGAPEQPRRVVGRCMDAPREHVFTFDPVTHSGQRMP